MSTKYLDSFFEKYNIKNLINILIILIVLFLIYRLFTPSISKEYNDIFEGFTIQNNLSNFLLNSTYGNVLFLKDPLNKPTFSNNQYIFILDDTYRIDSFTFTISSMLIKSIKYKDSLGNERPITFTPATTDSVNINDLKDDETRNVVITSQIILNIDSSSSPTATSLTKYGIYGGKPNELRLKDDLNKVSNLLKSDQITSVPTTSTTFGTSTTYTYPIGDATDKIIYGFQYTGTLTNPVSTELPPPFNISISYNNTLYPSNNFNINNTYKVRSDSLNDNLSSSIITANIYFGINDVIIANQLMLSLQGVKDSNGNEYNISTQKITCLYSSPTASEITAYKQNVNFLMNSSSGKDNTGVCPSINELINKQTMTQQVCDNLEYQDKVKSEKIRLERNKQYLLKLKDQQDQIDQLNMAIQDLENKRQERSQNADQIRVLQYQKQKADVSSVIDLANQRLTSQDKNKLYMDVNLNYVQ